MAALPLALFIGDIFSSKDQVISREDWKENISFIEEEHYYGKRHDKRKKRPYFDIFYSFSMFNTGGT